MDNAISVQGSAWRPLNEIELKRAAPLKQTTFPSVSKRRSRLKNTCERVKFLAYFYILINIMEENVSAESFGDASRIFNGHRALGLVSNHLPLVTRYITRRKETLVVTAIGNSFHTYGVS